MSAEKTLGSIARVAARYLSALDKGRSMFNDKNLKLHRWSDSLEVTDMTNAGKRGKAVSIVHVRIPYDVRNGDKVLDQCVNSVKDMNFDQAKAKLKDLQEKYKLFKLEEKTARGVDIEPAGTKIELAKTFPDGKTIRIEATPQSFMVKSSFPISAPGKPAHGMMQDTLYTPLDKKSGAVFYAWLKDNMSKAGSMTIDELRKTWDSLGVRWDSH